MSTVWSWILGSGLVLGASSASAAGFDCAKASSWAEKTICAKPGLSKLDDSLTTAYRSAMRKTLDRAAMRASQLAWLNDERDACTSQACLTRVYQRRLRELQRIAGGGSEGQPSAGHYRRWLHGQPDANSADIRIRPLGAGVLYLKGNAISGGVDGGVARTGSFEGTATLSDNRILFAASGADACRLVIELSKDALSVSDDNGECGGLNVTFDGAYRKEPG